VQVLDDECAIRTGCFWLNFEQLQPVDITAPITRKMVAMVSRMGLGLPTPFTQVIVCM
jgi:hypothetical protein